MCIFLCLINLKFKATIDSEFESNAVKDFLNDNGFAFYNFWIGLNDIANETVYVWDETDEETMYFEWAESK